MMSYKQDPKILEAIWEIPIDSYSKVSCKIEDGTVKIKLFNFDTDSWMALPVVYLPACPQIKKDILSQ